jgi:tetratricopeptide (TPR) repeat protein
MPLAVRRHVDTQGTITEAEVDPIAADLRPHGDGRRLASLKLIAGLTGVRLDDLVHREANRRHQRLLWLACFALLGMLFTGALALVALQARNEARTQRSQAEDLVEFMLTDLRRNLEPVGRLDIMDSVGQRALDYYGKQDPGKLDANSLGRRSRALLLVGEVSNLRGDLDGALSTYRRAAETTAEQLRRDPAHAQRIFDHAQSVFWVGYVAWQRGEAGQAREAFNSYRSLARRLVELEPSNEAWAAEEAYAETSLGVLEMEQARPEVAFEHFERSRAIWAALLPLAGDPRQRTYDLAQAIAWKADAQRRMHELDHALALRSEETRLYEKLLAEGGDDNKARGGKAVSRMRAAQIMLESGRTAEAAAVAEASFQDIRALHEQDRENRLVQEMAVKSANVLTEALMLVGDWDGAAKVNQWALGGAAALLQADAGVTAWRSDCLLPARWMQSAIAMARGRHAEAARQLDAFKKDFVGDSAGKSEEARFGWLVAHLLSIGNARALGESARMQRDEQVAREYLARAQAPLDARFSAAADWLATASQGRETETGSAPPQPEGKSTYRLTGLISAPPPRR